MTEPPRAARLWLAVAVASLWRLSVGGVAAETIPASTLLDVTAVLPGPRRSRQATRLRLGRIVRRGWITSLVAVLDQAPLPLGACRPEPWPVVPIGAFQARRPALDVHQVAASKNLPQKAGARPPARFSWLSHHA